MKCKMKKVLIATFFAVLCIAVAWFGTGRYVLSSHADKVWQRQCDTLRSASSGAGCHCVEVYVKDDGRLMVMRSADSTDVVPIDSYFRYLRDYPQGKLWMRLHNLTDGNMNAFTDSLGRLGGRHGLRESQFILESSNWVTLGMLAKFRFCVAVPLVADDPSCLTERQKDSVITRLDRIVESGRITAIDLPRSWYGILRRQYRHRDIRFFVRIPDTAPRSIAVSPQMLFMLCDRQVRGVVEEQYEPFVALFP